MRLFLDIDGVLLNFEHAFVGWLNHSLGLDLPEDYEAESWDFEELMDKGTLHKAWLEFLESERSGRMRPLVDTGRLNRLAERHPLHLVTNFPLLHMDKRKANLEAVGLRYESLNYCGLHAFDGFTPRTKAQVIADLHLDGETALFVDDHPANCVDVHENCPQVEVWVMSRGFNRSFEHPQIRRAQGWDGLFDRLDALAAGAR